MSRKPREPLTPTRLDLAKVIRFSMWFFVAGLAAKLLLGLDLSWWLITAPMWSSLLFSMFTTSYHADGRVKNSDEA